MNVAQAVVFHGIEISVILKPYVSVQMRPLVHYIEITLINCIREMISLEIFEMIITTH